MHSERSKRAGAVSLLHSVRDTARIADAQLKLINKFLRFLFLLVVAFIDDLGENAARAFLITHIYISLGQVKLG